MTHIDRDNERERRKDRVIEKFNYDESLYTNEIAKRIDVKWPTTDKILQELVDEGRLLGSKIEGYRLPDVSGVMSKLRRLLHV